jgi:hypothetical protein
LDRYYNAETGDNGYLDKSTNERWPWISCTYLYRHTSSLWPLQYTRTWTTCPDLQLLDTSGTIYSPKIYCSRPRECQSQERISRCASGYGGSIFP